MKLRVLFAGALMSAGCGTSVLDVQAQAKSESSEIGEVQNHLSVRLEEKFGSGARIQQVFGRGDQVVLGVALDARVEESDIRPGLALAKYRKSDDVLDVLAEKPDFKEAQQLAAGLAVVTREGELRLRNAEGIEKTLTTDVKGEVSSAPGGALVATLEGGSRPKGDSAVFHADVNGNVTVLADAEGVDDRPSVSPDEKTVVFVSGRTGVASLWVTTLDGAEPKQLTNKDLLVGEERTGPPEGFVPPPVMADRIEWVSADEIRYDAGDAEMWTVNVRTGEAKLEGGAR